MGTPVAASNIAAQNFSTNDHRFMARALQLARQVIGHCDPNPAVGCVLVRANEIVGEGRTQQVGGPHAEICALEQAGEKSRGSTAYVTLEPCSHQGRTGPCADALIAAGVSRVVAAMEDPNPEVSGDGLKRMHDSGIKTSCGLLESQSREINPGFISRMTTGMPFVRLKMAMSFDGRTALANGESQWITGPAARADVQRFRARSSAILTGIGTILADDPSLNVRLPGARQPLRVILDSKLRTPPVAITLSLPGKVLLFSASENAQHRAALQATGAEVIDAPITDRGLNLHYVMHELARREVNEVHVECGPILAGALLGAGLVNEMVVYMASCLLGDAARGLFELPAIKSMSDKIELNIGDVRMLGSDVRFMLGRS